MTIGQVARKTGLRASAIRFYERAGLLPKPVRRNGQRHYDEQALDRLALVEFAKSCGFTLDEVRRLFDGFRDNAPLSARVRGLASKKIQELDALAKRIEVMKTMLARAERCRCVALKECGRRLRTAVPC